ncbi:MAG: pirin family protein [Rhodospirillales bacterium]
MSFQDCPEADCQTAKDADASVIQVIEPRTRDLGGFTVGRVLPVAKRRNLGPFVFLDQMGPTTFGPDRDFEVRAHPHIGLATVTYLWDGWMQHKDSLGNDLAIRPGALNLMTAGRGIVHVERNRAADRPNGTTRLYGFQVWIALPQSAEEGDPAFVHHPAEDLPAISGPGWQGRVVLGRAFDAASPVATASETLYVDLALEAGASLEIPPAAAERGLLLVEGKARLDDTAYNPQRLLVLAEGSRPLLRAEEALRVLLIGGAPLDGPRHLWWNFVSSSKERIEQAKADWRAGRFDEVAGESDFIPLPED